MKNTADVSRSSGLKLAEKLQEKISNAIGGHVRVILFGSQARGEATGESDVDVLVVLPDLKKPTLDLVLEIAWEVGFEAGKVISVIPAADDEMELLSASPFFQTVLKEGIAV